MQTPDLMPIIARGSHSSPADGACIMEMASHLAGEEWSDRPACVHWALAAVARTVNDRLPDDERHLILPLLPRLMGTTVGLDQATTDALVTWAGGQASQNSNNLLIAPSLLLVAANRAPNYGMGFLVGLIDEYDRLTGRTNTAPLATEDARRLVELTNA